MPLVELTGFLGANRKLHRRFLPDGVGVDSVNQKPSEQGDLQPWRVPLAVSPAPNVPADRISLYRMGRDAATPATHWLSWTAIVHAIRGFDQPDTTERTYYTGSGTPKWTDNIQALAGAPYPTASRELAVPQPTVAPGATLNTDGATGGARRLYYCFTWINDIGWESAPSPPVLAPLAKPGAILDLTISESVPAGNYGVTLVRWYRTQTVSAEGDAEFFFLREYAVGAGGMQDDARDLGVDILPTGPDDMRLRIPTDAHSLTACWNAFAACLSGKTVRFCEPELIYAYPLGSEYQLASTPKAMAAFAQRLLVLTTDGAEVFLGSDPLAMDQKPLALAPIVSVRSLVVGDTWAAWAAADGLWAYSADGSARNLLADILTAEQWAAMVPSTMHCHYLQVGTRPLIVGFYNDGTLKGFVVDPANPSGMYFLSQGYTAAYWDKLLRKLFVLEGATLKEWDAGASFMTATFTSKVHRQVAHTEGEWCELLCSGAATVKVYTEQAGATDDATALVERMNRAVTRGEHRLPNGTGGRDFQVTVSTMGSVQGLILE